MITPQEAVQLVEAVQLFEARKRKHWVYKTTTFYSKMDLWHYVLEAGADHCEHCLKQADQIVLGSALRGMFPDHTVKSRDHIYVNYHMTLWGKPTCKCYLYRVDSAADPYSSKFEPEVKYGEEPSYLLPNPVLNQLPIKDLKGLKVKLGKEGTLPHYNVKTSTLTFDKYLLNDVSPKTRDSILRHEIGHHVHRKQLTHKEEKEWEIIVDKYESVLGSRANNRSEVFAWAYDKYHGDEKELLTKHVPVIALFIRKYEEESE